jgi:hypothetical protein
MIINSFRVFLAIDGVLEKRDAQKVRGYLGNIFWENPYAHHHNPDGSLIYEYPRIQYKVINGNCLILAYDEGVEIVKKVFDDLESILLDENWKNIHSKALEMVEEQFDATDEPIEYQFLTPWLALNEENYRIYKSKRTFRERKWLLENILTANIISVAKSLGFTIEKQIHTSFVEVKPISVNVKNVKMAGFYGTFITNFRFPSFWGLGKSVARGFGTVIQTSELKKFKKGLMQLLPEPNTNRHQKRFKRKRRI